MDASFQIQGSLCFKGSPDNLVNQTGCFKIMGSLPRLWPTPVARLTFRQLSISPGLWATACLTRPWYFQNHSGNNPIKIRSLCLAMHALPHVHMSLRRIPWSSGRAGEGVFNFQLCDKFRHSFFIHPLTAVSTFGRRLTFFIVVPLVIILWSLRRSLRYWVRCSLVL